MKKLVFITFLISITGCSSAPTLPEPEGPLIKVNVDQPHEVYSDEARK